MSIEKRITAARRTASGLPGGGTAAAHPWPFFRCVEPHVSSTPTEAQRRSRHHQPVGQHFWARGYFVSTVGRDEAVIREYIRKQDQEDLRLDQMNLRR